MKKCMVEKVKKICYGLIASSMGVLLSIAWLPLVADASGQASVWTLNSSGQLLSTKSYSPGGAWIASSYQRMSDGTGRLLWTTTAGQASVWTLNSSGGLTATKSYSPGSTWEATSYQQLTNGNGRMLWTMAGKASVWALNSSGGFTGNWSYSPGSTWRATSYQRLVSGNSLLLWTKPGQASIWAINSSGGMTGSWNFAPGSTWEAQGVERLSDGTTRLVWSRSSDGAASVWSLNSSGGLTGSKSYAPAGVWIATSFSPTPTSSAGAATNVLKSSTLQKLTVKKAGSGNGTISVGTQVCDEICSELEITYIAGKQVDVNVTVAADSYFAGWETAGGVQLENIYYANPGDTVFAIFEQK